MEVNKYCCNNCGPEEIIRLSHSDNRSTKICVKCRYSFCDNCGGIVHHDNDKNCGICYARQQSDKFCPKCDRYFCVYCEMKNYLADVLESNN